MCKIYNTMIVQSLYIEALSPLFYLSFCAAHDNVLMASFWTCCKERRMQVRKAIQEMDIIMSGTGRSAGLRKLT